MNGIYDLKDSFRRKPRVRDLKISIYKVPVDASSTNPPIPTNSDGIASLYLQALAPKNGRVAFLNYPWDTAAIPLGGGSSCPLMLHYTEEISTS